MEIKQQPEGTVVVRQPGITPGAPTRLFYERFKAERSAFLASIEGIARQTDRERYVTLLLNRLIFLYFLQKKLLLAGDPDYLLKSLQRVQVRSDSTQSFYRDFLLRFFYDDPRKAECCREKTSLFAAFPSFVQGLFEVHELERLYPAIRISNQAFTRLFAFFDQFTWSLDTSSPARTSTIAPDVLATLCEKYGEQKPLGAYYTQADVTEYIAQNTLLPALFDAFKERCPAMFAPEGSVWSLLREYPERYIYPALRKGCLLPLPPEIEVGVQTVSRRLAWNQVAPAAYALPTETWREVVARRQHAAEVLRKLRHGDVHSVHDLLTCNLDLRRLAQDVLNCCQRADQLGAFYESLHNLSVLDPTCGSGAFLFAACDQLEPLYEACLVGMQEKIAHWSRLPGTAQPEGERIRHFCKILSQVAHVADRRYFIVRSILTHNLFGVDILQEATEICRLRLCLRLIAEVRCAADLATLTEVTCHIRTGNTLVGLVTTADVALQHAGLGTVQCSNGLADQCPFHWPIEFQEIMQNGGFSVIIGNPPYIAESKTRQSCGFEAYMTASCGNLCAYTVERASALLRRGGCCGMIVPISAVSSPRYRPLTRLLSHYQLWLSSYSNRPGKLFVGAEQRLAIILLRDVEPHLLLTSAYQHWYNVERERLFHTLTYIPASIWSHTGMPLKSGSVEAERIFTVLSRKQGFPLLHCQQGRSAVWVHNGPTYWVRALPFEPYGRQKSLHSDHYYRIPVASPSQAFILAAILSSSTFYFFYKQISNCRDLGPKELRNFPLGELQPEQEVRLTSLGCSLAERLKATSVECSRRYPSGIVTYQEYYPARARVLLDEIDSVLAEHYGFTDEELDFIVNYDNKYRMSQI